MFVWVVGVGCWCGLLVRVVNVGSKCSLVNCKCFDLQSMGVKEVINLLQKQFVDNVIMIRSLMCGVLCCGVVWCGVVWCGVVWCGVVWCGVVWCSVV